MVLRQPTSIILLLFAYMLLSPNCITGDIFCQLYDDNLLSTIKKSMKIESIWWMKN